LVLKCLAVFALANGEATEEVVARHVGYEAFDEVHEALPCVARGHLDVFALLVLDDTAVLRCPVTSDERSSNPSRLCEWLSKTAVPLLGEPFEKSISPI